MVQTYAVRLRFGGQEVRYAQKRLVITEQGEDGVFYPTTYLPYLLNVKPFSAAIDLDGRFPKPSSSMTVADPERTLADFFSTIEAEYAETTLFVVGRDGQVLSEVDGYVTDLKHSEGKSDFTFLINDDKADSGYMEFFQEDSFQWFDVFRPFDVEVRPTFALVRDIPWRVFAAELRRTTIDYQKWRLVGRLGGFENEDPIGGLTGSSELSVIKLTISGDNGNRTRVRQLSAGFFLKVAELVPTAGSKTYTFEYNGNTCSFTANDTHDENDILASISSCLSGFLVGNYHDTVKERLWVVGDRTLVGGSSTISSTHLSIFYDRDAPASYAVAQEREEEILLDPNGGYYKLAVLGNSEYTTRTELIAYAYCKKGLIWDTASGSLKSTNDDNWYLSGIPTAADPFQAGLGLAEAQSLDPTIVDGADFASRYGIKNEHRPYEFIAEQGKHDVVYIDSAGLVPESLDDPKYGVGFVSFGDTLDRNGEDIVKFHRYKLTNTYNNVVDPTFDGTIVETLLKLEINNRAVDPGHTYAVQALQGGFELPRGGLYEDDPVFIGNWQSTLVRMDVLLTGYDDQVEVRLQQEEQRDLLRDRYKGFRIDMLADVEDLRQVISQQQEDLAGTDAVSQSVALNQRLLNNTDGLFAVCTGSEIVKINNEYIEYLYFFDSYEDNTANPLFLVEEDLEGETDPDAIEERSGVKVENAKEIYYTNYLVYDPDFKTASEQVNTDIFSLGVDYFTRSTYRVVRDPVPQKGEDLTKAFPIVYGYAQKVPLLHVISKKPVRGIDITSGDDVYVYAAHSCDVQGPSDITIYLEEGDKVGDTKNDTERYGLNIQPHIVKSPFPSYVRGHHELYEEQNPVTGRFVGFTRGRVTLYNPYHRLRRLKTLGGVELQSIQLRGDEWDYRLGQLDKRFPIRNGLGSSRLYATFGGHVSKDGLLIEHPVDIFKHFVQTYGDWPYNERFLDLDSLEEVKSLTRNYVASVYLDQPVGVEELAANLFKQFALFPYLESGALKVRKIDLDVVDWSKPIAENLNLLEGVVEESKFLKNIYDRITIDFAYNYITKKYDGRIALNALNNQYCAKASKAKGGRREFKIEAKYLHDAAVAREVANIYARLLSQRRIEYTLQIFRDDDIVFSPGEIVPVTYRRFDLFEEPVVVLEVSPDQGVYEIRVVRIG